MVALENGPYQQALADFGALHIPKAIVVISAHWVTGSELKITSSSSHATIHDFAGFPRTLYEIEYNAPGAPELAKRIESILSHTGIHSTLDSARGLDHGAWVPLRFLYPKADIPVIQISLPILKTPEELFKIGTALAPLRKESIMILGSGGIVHNLGMIDPMHRDRQPEPWAETFDGWIAEQCELGDTEELFHYQQKAPYAALAVPTPEHFLPLFIALGAGSGSLNVKTIFEGFAYGTLSMRCFSISD